MRLAVMHPDSGVSAHARGALCLNINVVQECEQLLTILQLGRHCLQCPVLAKGEKQGHQRIALLSSLTLWN